MDVLFVPLASAVGASVDQIKVSSLDLRVVRRRRAPLIGGPCSAHHLPFGGIPTRKSLHSHSFFSTSLETSIQPWSYTTILLSRSQTLHCIFATLFERPGDLPHRVLCSLSQDAVDCFCVSEYWQLVCIAN